MPRFAPQIGTKSAPKNIRSFVEDHKNVFWGIWKPMTPYVLAACFLDLLLVFIFPPSITAESAATGHTFGIGGLINAYFLAALAISWHRVVIHGPDDFVPMDPFRPKRHELVFMLMCVVIPVAVFVLGVVLGLLGTLAIHLSPIITTIFIISAFLFVLFITYKVSFFFPAQATNSPITIKESFALTNNKRIGEFYMVPLLSSWKVIVMVLGYSLLSGMLFMAVLVLGGQMAHIAETGTMPFAVYFLSFLVNLPLIFYFNPLLMVYGITSLSNYYQYALQRDAHTVV